MCKIGKRVLTKGGRGDIINKLSGDGRRGSGRGRSRREARESLLKKERKKRLTSGKEPDRIYKLHRLAEERKGKSGWKPKRFLKKVLDKAD
jgi:hypothetical protein